jgi:FlaA1/EpsC-like NDP-sugar epimerase
MVFVSTDKAVNPTNVMGASKRLAERLIQYSHQQNNNATAFITTRFGNVLGSNGSVIPTFKKQIENGGPVTVTHPDVTRYFMTIPEACQLVLEACTIGKGGELMLFDMGELIKIDTIAKRMIQLSGKQLDTEIKIEYTGLRPGEKLYEELLTNDEDCLPTHHPKIMIGKHNHEVKANEIAAIQQFLSEYKILTNLEIKQKLTTLVPEYAPEFL